MEDFLKKIYPLKNDHFSFILTGADKNQSVSSKVSQSVNVQESSGGISDLNSKNYIEFVLKKFKIHARLEHHVCNSFFA